MLFYCHLSPLKDNKLIISNHLVIIRGDNRVTIAVNHAFYCHFTPISRLITCHFLPILLPITYDSMPITYYLLLITYYVPLYSAPDPIQQIPYTTGIFHL
jgi:hypothetical protein